MFFGFIHSPRQDFHEKIKILKGRQVNVAIIEGCVGKYSARFAWVIDKTDKTRKPTIEEMANFIGDRQEQRG